MSRFRQLNSPQLFRIPTDVLQAMSYDETMAIARDLKELDLFRLPYPTVDMEVPAHPFVNLKGNPSYKFPPEALLTVRGVSTEQHKPISIIFKWTTNPRWEGYNIQPKNSCGVDQCREMFTSMLIVMLSVRNIRKETRHNKLAKLGIGKKKHPHEYVTTLLLPEPSDMEDDKEHAPGTAMTPHLRRGHIRRQHYGPKGSFIKKVWIEPVFVNADKEFVKTRQAYHCSMPALTIAEQPVAQPIAEISDAQT